MLLNNRWLSAVTNQPKIARNTKLMMTSSRHSGGFLMKRIMMPGI
jgi:hypothetical protein